MARIIQVIVGQRIITGTPVRQERLHSEVDPSAGMETVKSSVRIAVDDKVRMIVQFQIEARLQHAPEDIVILAEVRPEIAEIYADLSHAPALPTAPLRSRSPSC